ncbi:MAG: hypothetical protein ACLUE1_05010 [Adlercreutzia equolifaciens]
MVKYREILRLVAMGGEPGKRRVLLRVRGMTPSLLWNEYCDAAVSRGEEPYMYSAFCREYRAWAQAHVSISPSGGAAPSSSPQLQDAGEEHQALIVNEQYRRGGHWVPAVPARA